MFRCGDTRLSEFSDQEQLFIAADDGGFEVYVPLMADFQMAVLLARPWMYVFMFEIRFNKCPNKLFSMCTNDE